MEDLWLKATMKKQLVIFSFIFVCATLNGQTDMEDWFPFQPSADPVNSRINMESWRNAPTGRHGFLKMRGDDFYFEDGKAVKFWV